MTPTPSTPRVVRHAFTLIELLVVIAIIGILGVVNWASVQYGGKLDLTNAKRYTLADQTRKILGSLDRDVKIIAFFPSRLDGDPFSRGTKALLQEYAGASKRVTIEFIDPEINPGAARQYDIKAVPVTLFTSGERKEETTGLTEQDFTSALLKLTRTEKKKVYFLQGHQERDPDSAQQGGMNVISQALKRENYVVDKLSLLATSTVPADGDAAARDAPATMSRPAAASGRISPAASRVPEVCARPHRCRRFA